VAQVVTGGDYTRVYCPACPTKVGKVDRSKACSVSNTTGWWLCHRCGYRGRLDGYDDQDDLGLADAQPVDLEQPSDYVEVTPARAASLAAAVRFLHSRRVHPSKWSACRIGYARTGIHAGRVVLPLVQEDDWRQVGWVGRLVYKGKPWEHTYHTAGGVKRDRAFWNLDALTAPDPRPLIVTEGPLDALRLFPHAVACLGKPTRDQLATLARCQRPLVFALDADAWQTGYADVLQLRAAGRPAWCLALPTGFDPDTYPPQTLLDAAKYAVAHTTDLDLAR
jgi:hypothetical protein